MENKHSQSIPMDVLSDEIYVCAKFGNEWQGMKIIKQ